MEQERGSAPRDGLAERVTRIRETPGGVGGLRLPERLGPYVLGRELARGGMGAVFVARHAELGRDVALKVVLGRADPVRLRRFEIEAQATARLRHPNIVPVHELGAADGIAYLVMELVAGESLAARLAREGPFEPRVAAELVAKIADALAVTHAAAILHRDLKPANVLLDATSGEPRLTDFGVAKLVDDDAESLTKTGARIGTPAYMSPEQATGELDRLGPHTDVWALGVILYELLTGQLPFRGEGLIALLVQITREPPPSPSRLASGIPPELEAVCLRCLEKKPEARYPDAAALAADLRAFLAGAAVAARSPGAPRAAKLAVSGAAAALILAVAAGAAFVGSPVAPAAPADPSPAAAQAPAERSLDPAQLRRELAEWRERIAGPPPHELAATHRWLARAAEVLDPLELESLERAVLVAGLRAPVELDGGEPREVFHRASLAWLDAARLVTYEVDGGKVQLWQADPAAHPARRLLAAFRDELGDPGQRARRIVLLSRLAVDPAGGRLWVATPMDARIRGARWPGGEPLSTFAADDGLGRAPSTDSVESLAFEPARGALAAGMRSGAIRVFPLDAPGPPAELPGAAKLHGGAVVSLAWLGTDRLVSLGGRNLRAVEAVSAQVTRAVPALRARERFGDVGRALGLWRRDAAGGWRLLSSQLLAGPGVMLRAHPASGRVVAIGAVGDMLLFDFGAEPDSEGRGLVGAFEHAPAPGGDAVAAFTRAVARGAPAHDPSRGPVTDAAFSRDGRWLFSVGGQRLWQGSRQIGLVGRAVIWEVETRQRVTPDAYLDLPMELQSAELSPTGRWLACYARVQASGKVLLFEVGGDHRGE